MSQTRETREPPEPEEYDADLLILGASFTGIELLRLIRNRRRGRELEIIVVDRQTTHPYIPLAHELLSERMATSVEAETVLDTAAFVRSRGAQLITAEISSFDPDSHSVELSDGRRISARFVVVALGSVVRPPPSLPGGDGLIAYKSKPEFEAFKRRLDQVCRAPDSGSGSGSDSEPGSEPDSGSGPPALIVVGGGITGVEIAGELAGLAQARPQGWRAPEVTLIHSGTRLLPGLHPRAGARAARVLEAQGVTLHLGARLLTLKNGSAQVRLADQTQAALPCSMGVWAGGLRPPEVLDHFGLARTEAGWLRVGPSLQCRPEPGGDPEIFAGGDVARIYGGTGEWPTMTRAIEGIFAAQTLCSNILELYAAPPGYPEGPPPLRPHRLVADFPHGVSAGAHSLLVYRRLVLAPARLNAWFRRFLMRQYIRRYRP